MGAVTTQNPWQPILGDDIGPTRADRARSAVALGTVIIILGLALAATLGIIVVTLFALVGATVG